SEHASITILVFVHYPVTIEFSTFPYTTLFRSSVAISLTEPDFSCCLLSLDCSLLFSLSSFPHADNRKIAEMNSIIVLFMHYLLYPSISFCFWTKSSSVQTSVPNCSAFVSFEPASSPAITKSVFFVTLFVTLAQIGRAHV